MCDRNCSKFSPSHLYLVFLPFFTFLFFNLIPSHSLHRSSDISAALRPDHYFSLLFLYPFIVLSFY